MSDDPASKDGLRWEIRRNLIERLRIRWEGMGEMGNQQRYEASVQISTMMDEIEAWKQAMQKAERDIAQVRAERDEARRELDDAREERDELRRRLCSYEGAWRRVNNPLDEAHLHDRPHEIAKEWGWDCFKENTNV